MINGVLSADTKDEIETHLEPHIKRDSVLCSDKVFTTLPGLV